MALKQKQREGAESRGALPVHFGASERLWKAVDQIARKWGCAQGEVCRRIVIMGLSGWKLKHQSQLSHLSRFVSDLDDPFLRACIILRKWFDFQETSTGDHLTDADIDAHLKLMLTELKQKDNASQHLESLAMLGGEDG